MPSRPRRVAAQKATTAITDMVDSESGLHSPSDSIVMSSRPSRRSDARSPPERPRSGLSGARSSGASRSALARENFVGGEILAGKRNRSQRKSYRVDSSEDDDAPAEDDLDAEGEDDDDDDMMDADGEIVVDADMDVDAEGEDDDADADADADGEDDMDVDPTPPPRQTVKVARPAAPARSSVPSKAKETARAPAKAAAQHDESDDEELSDLDSDADEIQDTVNVGGGEADDDDEEEEEEEDDEEIEDGAAGDEDEEEEGEPRELDSDDEGSDGGSPDLDKMTKRQRARFADDDGSLLKLSDEVQAKKVFTAEELSMRRAEMARRRRNLSEKRNEEVKMETIHKLLHKQAPKTSRKAQLAEDEVEEKPSPIFVRWINNKAGSIVAVPDEVLGAPPGRVFVPGGLKSGKMVEEVS
ncbi:PAPA-1-like conserved region-domain-containing protein [Microdochium bolleyi]|uniref:PAPA-1-like conserved region-domain-containing protein n=1 Tax=Microdochium bolleyi TaxID=196109 RepID=A0A136IXK9_9PEZI|nr:PAPA-1-like conserved region-domain-containing protein [Microdochium bolleyi]